MTTRFFCVLTTGLVMLLGNPALLLVDAECCPSYWSKLEKCIVCLDYTPPRPYCGYGPCNLFGCNCDGGCRRPPLNGLNLGQNPVVDDSEPLTVANFYEHSAFLKIATIDQDGDGLLSLDEFDDWVRRTRTGEDSEESIAELYAGFKEMDQNHDGYVSRNEVDDSFL